MPDFLRATATAIANMSCCCIHISTRIAMHLPCSCVSSMETIVELRVVILILSTIYVWIRIWVMSTFLCSFGFKIFYVLHTYITIVKRCPLISLEYLV